MEMYLNKYDLSFCLGILVEIIFYEYQVIYNMYSWLMFQVTFVNEQSGEYQYYELSFKSIKPGVISTIDLTTPVRQSVHHKIRLENPLAQAVVFSASCAVPEVLMPATLNVPPNSHVSNTSN